MATDNQLVAPICWRTARPCPLTSDVTPTHKTNCQAWFRCEMAGDYVIRWRCQTLGEPEGNTTGPPLLLCPNQTEAHDWPDCPPPVVCADDPYLDQIHVSSQFPTDVILGVAVSIFALLAVALIIVSSCKYWALKKRLRLQLAPNQALFGNFPYPLKYHGLWGLTYRNFLHRGSDSSNSSAKKSKSFTGNPYTDIFCTRPREASYFHHLSPPDNFPGKKRKSSEPDLGLHVYSTINKLAGDPSVATGSFVYHQPVLGGGYGELSEHGETIVDRHSNHHSQLKVETWKLEKSQDNREINSENIRNALNHENKKASAKTAMQREDDRCTVTSPEFRQRLQVASVPTPNFSYSSHQKTMAQHEYLNPKLHFHQQELRTATDPAGSSPGYQSHYALGFLTEHDESSQQIVHRHDVLDHHYQSPSPKLTKLFGHSSPDVISGHNFTNRFVRVARNLYRPLLNRSLSSSSSSGGTIGSGGLSQEPGDLSYDSFRNDHLRQLARRAVASSSTLDAVYAQPVGCESSTPLGRRH